MIRQFDVVRNPDKASQARVPYLALLQSHLLYDINTTIVAPLMLPELLPPDGVVAISVEVNGESFTLDATLLANVVVKRLGSAVATLNSHEYEIRRALDRLFTGF